jgi:hypothetical protein
LCMRQTGSEGESQDRRQQSFAYSHDRLLLNN